MALVQPASAGAAEMGSTSSSLRLQRGSSPAREPQVSPPTSGGHGASMSPAALGFHKLQVSSWNLGGASERDALTILSQEIQSDAVAVQEWPKAAPGWRFLAQGDLKVVVYQDVLMCRGVGLAYKDSSLQLLKKKHSGRGAWFLVRCKRAGVRLWLGSLRLQMRSTSEPFRRCCISFLQALCRLCCWGILTLTLTGPGRP